MNAAAGHRNLFITALKPHHLQHFIDNGRVVLDHVQVFDNEADCIVQSLVELVGRRELRWEGSGVKINHQSVYRVVQDKLLTRKYVNCGAPPDSERAFQNFGSGSEANIVLIRNICMLKDHIYIILHSNYNLIAF